MKPLLIAFLITSFISCNETFHDTLNTLEKSAPVPQYPPDAPNNLNAVAKRYDAVNLTWIDRSDNETGFTIERSTGGQSFEEIISIPADHMEYTDSGLDAEKKYNYRVKAFNLAGDSSYTGEKSAVTQYFRTPDAHWKFDEGTANDAFDSSGNLNNGVLRDGPSWVEGKVGEYALEFHGDGLPDEDANNEYGAILENSSLETNAFAGAAWVCIQLDDGEDRSCSYFC